jgi:hypothetical protein
MGYALRRTSARLVLVLAIGGLVWAVYRALRPADRALGLSFEGVSIMATPSRWDLPAAGLGVVVALVVAAFLWYERPTAR